MKSLHLAKPHAIMMVGIPGSGKTFFAEQFADMFQIPYVDSVAIEERAKDETAAGELIALLLTEVSRSGESFVFEGNSDSRVHRTEFARWARSRGYQPMFVWVQVDQATCLARTLKAKSLTRDQFQAVLRDFSPPHPDERPVVISGKHTYVTQARVVLTQMSSANRPEMRIKTPERVQPEVKTKRRRNISL